MAGQSIGLCSRLGDGSANFASAQSALFSAGSPRVAFRENSTEAIFVDPCVLGLEDTRTEGVRRDAGRQN